MRGMGGECGDQRGNAGSGNRRKEEWNEVKITE